MSNEIKKDANGRLPAAAYTPECIGANLANLFAQQEAPKVVGEAILCSIVGKDIPDAVAYVADALPELKDVVDGIVSTFTDAGATLDEVQAGAQDVLDKMQKFDADGGVEAMLQMLKERDDGETLH